MANDLAGLLDLMALLLEGHLHLAHSVGILCRSHLIKLLDTGGKFLQILGTLFVLGTAVLELLLQLTGIVLVLEHGLHLVSGDVARSFLDDSVLEGVLHGSGDLGSWRAASACISNTFSEYHFGILFKNGNLF